MNQRIFSFISLLLLSAISLQAQEIAIQKNMIVKKSIKVKKTVYKIDGSGNIDKAVIEIEGDNIVVDFNNCELRGSNTKKKPDEYFGLAIHINGGTNITIKNLTVKGYKIGLVAKNVKGLHIDNCNLSYNYRQHLNSTQEKEDISDWMSYHHNEKDEWLCYGAAM